MQSYRSESALTDYVGPRSRNRALTPLPHRARLEPSAAADVRTAQCGKMLCNADKSLTNFGDVSALNRIRPPPVNSCPAGSATPPEHPFKGSPVAGAPGWYVVQRTAPASSDHPWRWARRFALLAVARRTGAGRARAFDRSCALGRSAGPPGSGGLDAPTRHLDGDKGSSRPHACAECADRRPGATAEHFGDRGVADKA